MVTEGTLGIPLKLFGRFCQLAIMQDSTLKTIITFLDKVNKFLWKASFF
jgi:hypothetical protein